MAGEMAEQVSRPAYANFCKVLSLEFSSGSWLKVGSRSVRSMKQTPSPLRGLVASGAMILALVSAQAAFLTQYGAFKNRDHDQTGPVPANPPTISDYGVFAFAVQTETDALLFGSVSAGGPVPMFLSPDSEDPIVLSGEAQFGTLAALNAAAPNNTFDFQFLSGEGDQLTASVSAGATAFPDAPALKNFAAGQDIDRTQAFTLQWDPSAQLGAADYVIAEVEADGEIIARSPFPWEGGALTGTATSFTIPAGVLPAEAELSGRINFVKITGSDTAAIPGATGLAGYVSGTDFPLKVRGGGGGGDTTPPAMFLSQPLSGAMGVNANTVVSFTFTEAMQPMQGITWTGVANASLFSYAWTDGGTKLNCTYAGGFASGAVVGWQLVPAGFKDLAGNELVPFQITGSFTVGGGGGGCINGVEDQPDSFVLARFARFVQNSAAAPVLAPSNPDGDSSVSFFASFRSSAVNVTAAQFGRPDGQIRLLNNTASRFFFFERFNTQAALEAAYPAGNYTPQLTLAAGGTSSLAVNLGAAPTVPHCANYDAAQAINAAADFTLTWDAFAGATTTDYLDVVILDAHSAEVFRRPDECATPPKPLSPTATSVVIPASTLQAGQTYSVELGFFKTSDFKSNASPPYTASGGYFHQTRFNIKTTGGATTGPVITAYTSRPTSTSKWT